MSREILKVENLSMRFGGLLAVNGVALSVKEKQVVALIGPNGAGKTTVFNCLTGFYKPSGGSILLDGESIEGLPGHKIALKGVVRTFQNVRLFKDMTAVENLLIAQHRHLNTNFLAGLFKTPAFRKSEREAMEFAEYWLEKVHLKEFANRPAGTLAYGQQRRLEIARCMMTRPRILMLDEPAAGLNPKETEDLKALISVLREEHNVTVLLIEHDMKLVMSISDHIVVINQGTPLANGTPEQIRDNPEVIKAYLCGSPRAHSGSIRYMGEELVGQDSSQIMRKSIAVVPEGRRVFSRLTVEENLSMGGFFTAKGDYQEQMDKVLGLFPRLKERFSQRGGTMSGGEQQMLAIGRALMSKPKLLLLDEPSLGLAPIIIQQIFDIIEQLRKDGVTVFLVEQNANQALKIADRAYVLENGRVVMTGTGEALLTDPKVRDAYLGG
jgi:ABC-type branched-subunit amino acid transport system ATPase component